MRIHTIKKTVTIQTVPVCSEEAFGKAMDARACCCCAQPLLVSFPFAPPHYINIILTLRNFLIIILQRLVYKLRQSTASVEFVLKL